jgi:Protein of unknown function (DUF5672)
MIAIQKTACVVVPVYTTALEPSEWASLDRCIAVLGSHPIILAKPHGLDIRPILAIHPTLLSESFADDYFTSVKDYNRLLLKDEFYARFAAYEFMLICQLDAFVFFDRLQEWCRRGYDYVGAPWIPHNNPPGKLELLASALRRKYFRITNRQYKHKAGDHHGQQHYSVGNGGFSLRKIASMRSVLSQLDQRAEPYRNGERTPWAEDIFFCIEANRYRPHLAIPGFEESTNFAWETHPEVAARFCKTALPFGFHAWNKLSKGEWASILSRRQISESPTDVE